MAISQQELDDLSFLVEEEKLARDVYEHLCTKWGHGTHCTIKSSEQSHLDSISAKAVKYGAPIKVDLGVRGQFSIPAISTEYAHLIELGDKSLVEALNVGVAIEEMDIGDIRKFLLNSKQTDVQRVMTNLLDGSFNHLDSFNAALGK